jgi:hypothetical protein
MAGFCRRIDKIKLGVAGIHGIASSSCHGRLLAMTDRVPWRDKKEINPSLVFSQEEKPKTRESIIDDNPYP